MAHQVEHVLGKDEVTGSNPVSSSISPQIVWGLYFLLFRMRTGGFGRHLTDNLDGQSPDRVPYL